MITERLKIRPIEITDFEDVCAYGCDEETGRYMLNWPRSASEVQKYIEGCVASHTSGDLSKHVFAIHLNAEDKVIGHISILINEGAADIGWLSNKAYWRNGYMTEAVLCVMDYAFNTLNVRKIVATCTSENVGTYRVMKKCHMIKVKTVANQKVLIDGVEVFYDELTYEITRDQYALSVENHVINTLFKRRSIRKFKSKPVNKETIMTLLKAAASAPTAANCQPWEFIVISESEKLREIRDKFIFARYDAPVAIVVCGNMKLAFKGPGKEMWVQDCSAAIQNILIASTSLNLGSVWIGVYPLESNVKMVQKMFHMPEYVIPLGIVYIGYPDESKIPRHRLDEKRVYWQEYDAKRKHRTKNKPLSGHH